jgi:hypothetical protein
MPAVSKKQQRFMALCSHHPEKAKGKCPPKKVAKEFPRAPKNWKEKKKYY